MKWITGQIVALFLVCQLGVSEERIIEKPKAFETLVNPDCSHCVDEAKRRKNELKDGDVVLAWTRGKYRGGAIPQRFFLNKYRVISDTYGVFVHDPDAGFSRGFTASLDYTFFGWRNGVMVMKHKDGTLFSCLSGIAFAGPRQGERLTSWPTLVTTWSQYLQANPNGVAYHMFEKYKPVENQATLNDDSVKTRQFSDKRLGENTSVLGAIVPQGKELVTKVYPIGNIPLRKSMGLISDTLAERDLIVVADQTGQYPITTAYYAVAEKRAETKKLSVEGDLLEEKKGLTFKLDISKPASPYYEVTTKTWFDIFGRGIEGPLKDWTLRPVEAVTVRWFAWAAEFPKATIWQTAIEKTPAPTGVPPMPKADPGKVEQAIVEIAGTAEYLRSTPKKFAQVKKIDVAKNTVELIIEDEKETKTWTIEPEAELKKFGWWGRLEQFTPKEGERVWVWFKIDRQKKPTSILMLCDEPTEKDIHQKDDQIKGFAEQHRQQQLWLSSLWEKQGLPGTLSIVHIAGEVELLVDHEGMRWARSLRPGSKVKLNIDTGIAAVVKEMKPWRERTLLKLVVNGTDIADLRPGQRVNLLMPTPGKEVITSDYPSDLGLPRGKAERIEWFLASIYCTCKVANDICTGDFYTLASCNPNGCGMPNSTKKLLAKWIDEGLDDKQIFDNLRAERGTLLTRPHLVK